MRTDNDTIKFLIDTTVFDNCSNDGKGGCIFYSRAGEFVQDRVCGYASKVNSQYTEGVYCYIEVSSNIKNFIYDSSISRSGDESNKGYGNLYLTYGLIKIKSVNNSFSTIYYDDFLYIISYSYESSSSFSTFSNTTSANSYHNKMYFSGSPQTFEFQNCNFLNNKNSTIIGINHGIVYIKHSSFINNAPSRYFWGQITFDECFFDEYPAGSFNFLNNITNEFTNYLSHFSTANCYADRLNFNKCSKNIHYICIFVFISKRI